MARPKKKQSKKQKSKKVEKNNEVFPTQVDQSLENADVEEDRSVIIEDQIEEVKEELLTYVLYDLYKNVLQSKDIEALKLLTIAYDKSSSKKVNFNDRFFLPTLISIFDKPFNEDNKKIIEFLTSQKIFEFDGKIYSENDVVKEMRELKPHLRKKFAEKHQTPFNKSYLNNISLSINPEEAVNPNTIKGTVNLIKALYAKENNIIFFKQSVDAFIKSFSDNKIFTEHASKQEKEDATILKVLTICLSKCFRTKQSFILDKKVIENCTFSLTYRKINAYTDFFEASRDGGFKIEALQYLSIIEEIIFEDTNITSQDKLTFYFNAAIIYRDFDGIKVIEYCNKYLELNPHNTTIITVKRNAYIFLGRGEEGYTEWVEDLKKINLTSSVSDLEIAMLKHNGLNDILLALNNNNFSQAFEKFNEKKFQLTIDNQIELIVRILRSCISLDKKVHAEALDFYEQNCRDIPRLKNADNMELSFFVFLLYFHNNCEMEIQDELKKINLRSNLGPVTQKIASQANEIFIAYQIQNHNYDAAQEWINNNYLEDTKKLKFLKLIDILRFKENEAGQRVEDCLKVNIETDKVETIQHDENNLLEIEWAEGEEELETVIEYNPQIIHAYFQYKKKLLLNNYLKQNFEQSKASWDIDSTHKFDTNNNDVYSIKGREKFYALIDKKLENKLGSNLSQFINSLEKGIVSRKLGQNGIKFIDDIIELKINDDLRLYTKTIYKNPNGEYLIIFDSKENHKGIKRKNDPNKKITVIEVPFIEANFSSSNNDDLQHSEPMEFNEEEFQKFLIENQDKIEDSVEYIGEA